LACSSAGGVAAALSDGTIICYRDVDGSLREYRLKPTAILETVFTIAYLGEDRLVAGINGGVKLWSISSQRCEQYWKVGFDLSCVRCDDDCQVPFILAGGRNRRAVVIQGDKMRVLSESRGDAIAVCISPKREVIATGDTAGLVKLYPADDLSGKASELQVSPRAIMSMQTCTRGSQLAIMDGAGRLSCWDSATGKQLWVRPNFDSRGSILFGFALDGGILICVGSGIHLLNPRDGAEVRISPQK
jgi:hypothetical protein